jgi:hypothetical protein
MRGAEASREGGEATGFTGRSWDYFKATNPDGPLGDRTLPSQKR